MRPDELSRMIAERRASDAARRRNCSPRHVRIGTLTATVDEFPSSQLWADEVERVLAYTAAAGLAIRHRHTCRGGALRNTKQRVLHRREVCKPGWGWCLLD